MLQTLPNPVNIKVFAKGEDFDRYRDKLDEFQYVSKRVNVEYVDVYKRPAVAEQYQIQQEGTVVFEYGGRTERATNDTEQDLANALIKAVQGKEKTAYFVQGHGEKDTTGSDRTGFNGITQALKTDNFKVEPLALAQKNAVPDEATVVVIAGPRADYLPGEIDMLRAYLKKGGRLLVLLDPPARADSPQLTNLASLLHEWGIQAGSDVVVDVSGIGRMIGTDASVPVAVNYPAHPAVERFNLMTAYPLARSITPVSGGVEGRTAQTIIETSPNSWAESDVKTLLATGKVERDEKQGDKPGPISLAAAVSAAAPEPPPAAKPANQVEAPDDGATKKPETRVVVIGDSDFAANGFLGLPGSRDLFLNVTNWLAGPGKHDRDPAARGAGSPARDERRPAAARDVADDLHHSGPHHRDRHPHLVAEAVRGCADFVRSCSSSSRRRGWGPTSISSSRSASPAPSPRPRRKSSPESSQTKSRRSRWPSRTATGPR